MTAYFSLVYDANYPNCIILRTSDTDKYINDAEGVQEKLEIKLEHDLFDSTYITFNIEEGQHMINVEDNEEQTLWYAQQIFEELTGKDWIYVAEGKIIGDSTEMIFDNARI